DKCQVRGHAALEVAVIRSRLALHGLRAVFAGGFRIPSRQGWRGALAHLSLVSMAMLFATASAPALAQTNAPPAKAPVAQPASPSQTVPSVTREPEPVFDEGTAQRIAAA